MTSNRESICVGIMKVISEIRQFIDKERTQAEKQLKLEYWERDMRLLDKIEENMLNCKETTLKKLLVDIRGLSHYFGSYVSDTDKLDNISDDLYHKVQEAILALRNSER